jgi:hypothetical protein
MAIEQDIDLLDEDQVEPLDAEDELLDIEDLDAAENDLFGSDPLDAEDELGIATEIPATGRGYAYDFGNERFVRSGTGVLATYNLDTLRGWIIKMLRTPRGGAVVHSQDIGMEDPEREIGMLSRDIDRADLEERITDALLVHPRIVGIDDFDLEFYEDADYAFASFTVLLDSGEEDTDEETETDLFIERLPVAVS